MKYFVLTQTVQHVKVQNWGISFISLRVPTELRNLMCLCAGHMFTVCLTIFNALIPSRSLAGELIKRANLTGRKTMVPKSFLFCLLPFYVLSLRPIYHSSRMDCSLIHPLLQWHYIRGTGRELWHTIFLFITQFTRHLLQGSLCDFASNYNFKLDVSAVAAVKLFFILLHE